MNQINNSNSKQDYSIIIEIAMNSDPVKYELSKHGYLEVDRIMNVSMHYPCNYGCITSTRGGDGDLLDALVISQYPLIPGCRIKGRPIGVLVMEDESGIDEKILFLPTVKIDPFFAHIQDIGDLDQVTKNKIKHFFERYKDLDQNKWVKVHDWQDAKSAHQLIAKYWIYE